MEKKIEKLKLARQMAETLLGLINLMIEEEGGGLPSDDSTCRNCESFDTTEDGLFRCTNLEIPAIDFATLIKSCRFKKTANPRTVAEYAKHPGFVDGAVYRIDSRKEYRLQTNFVFCLQSNTFQRISVGAEFYKRKPIKDYDGYFIVKSWPTLEAYEKDKENEA